MGLTYNTVDLGSYLLTQKIDQGPVYDPSRSDQIYTSVVLRCKSVLYANCLAAVGGETPPATAARIRHYLTAPRRPLSYSVGGVSFIDLPGGLDDANGPMPLDDAFSLV